ncbi:putative secreted protein [Candidatus Protofrankia californiensis]|uniref:Putative secreted protein n=1 Tax=Candidatus Protofrankia californiensis TaxID=1839754 RepID=A0A1C3PAG1_9ACTN|nr:hypothetical protein [Protofrankia symbiont of Coriaria ruscifolia]SBW26804.1 putative secreted protein [Candidatus Protofrankia californiensis]
MVIAGAHAVIVALPVATSTALSTAAARLATSPARWNRAVRRSATAAYGS